MGFYNGSTRGFNESFSTSHANINDLLEDSSVATLPESASFYQCALEATAIDEANWNSIMKACGLQEYAYFLNTGEEFVYSEAAGGGFIESVKSFLRKVWNKIQAIFKKFMIFLGSATKSGKEFISKYRADINKAIPNIPDNAKYKGYTFTLNVYKDKVLSAAGTFKTAVSNAYSKGVSEISKDNLNTLKGVDLVGGATIDIEDSWDYEDNMEKVRGGLLGKTGTFSANEFSKELFEMLRNGDSNKEDMDLNGSLVTTAMASLDGYRDEEKAVKTSYTEIDKWFKDLEKSLNKVQEALAKEKTPNKESLIYIQRALSMTKGAASAIQTANGLFLTASKDRVNQAKGICVKVVSYKSKATGESYSFENYDGAGFMEAAIARMQ